MNIHESGHELGRKNANTEDMRRVGNLLSSIDNMLCPRPRATLRIEYGVRLVGERWDNGVNNDGRPTTII